MAFRNIDFKNWGFTYAGGFGTLFVIITSVIIGYKFGAKWVDIFGTTLLFTLAFIFLYWLIKIVMWIIKAFLESKQETDK